MKPTTANLEAQYAPPLTCPNLPETEETLTICPYFCSQHLAENGLRPRENTPLRLTAIVRSPVLFPNLWNRVVDRYACVVNKDVHPAEGVKRLGNHGIDIGFQLNIGFDGECASAELFYLFSDSVYFGVSPCSKDDVCTFFGKR